VRLPILNTQEDQEFTEYLRSKAAEAKREFGFPATDFLGMLGSQGGYATAQKLLHAKNPSSGFTALWENRRLDLSVEAIVVETKWRQYFDNILVMKAEARLSGAEYVFTPFLSGVLDQENSPKDGNAVSSSNAPSRALVRNYWWVNQNQTYKAEVPGGFLWSPKQRADGARNQFYENMKEVKVGDIIFSFCDTYIRAIGVAIGEAETSAKPDFMGAGASWSTDGWLVPVEFKELDLKIRPKDHIALLRPHLPEKYSPLQHSGDGLQSVYLASIPAPMADVLIELLGDEFRRALQTLGDEVDEAGAVADQQEEAIRGRTDIGATSRTQLIKSRRGQGIFKANVRLNENACRVTGINDPLHLRASHIKPWKDSSDDEKLNGCNGLLLSPHIDHLFDRGFISFSADGSLLISSHLDQKVLEQWGVSAETNVGKFNTEQAKFLEYHATLIFRK
jgi:hypothetical protein